MKDERAKMCIWKSLLLICSVSVLFTVAIVSEDSSARSYSDIKGYGNYNKAVLNSEYRFYYEGDPNDYTTGGYAKIYYYPKRGSSRVMAKKYLQPGETMCCIGKYRGKYYFNVEYGFGSQAVYTYKPRYRKFRLLAKKINFGAFKKRKSTNAHSVGLMKKRYVIAYPGMPSDAYCGYGLLYVYDLKKNKKRSMGYVHDYIKVGRKIYSVTARPGDWARSSKTIIIVKRCNLNGKRLKTIRKYRAPFLKDAYGWAKITKSHIKWQYQKTLKSGRYVERTFKKKYR